MTRSILISVISIAVGVGIGALVLRRSSNQPTKEETGVSRSFTDAESRDAEGISEITLERERCYGACPVYKVVLRRDGTATYIGKENAPRSGQFRSQQLPYQPIGAEFIRLARLVASQGFLKMNDRYAALVTDSDTVITSVVYNGQRKTVLNYAGEAPIELYGIERAIDGVAAQIRWEEDKH